MPVHLALFAHAGYCIEARLSGSTYKSASDAPTPNSNVSSNPEPNLDNRTIESVEQKWDLDVKSPHPMGVSMGWWTVVLIQWCSDVSNFLVDITYRPVSGPSAWVCAIICLHNA